MVITDRRSLGQITHCDVSKINAVKYLVNSFGYSLSDVIAFGDDYNDMDIIRECGIGVAMGNAENNLKEIADIITKQMIMMESQEYWKKIIGFA